MVNVNNFKDYLGLGKKPKDFDEFWNKGKKEVDKLTINNTIIQQTVKLVDDEIIYSTEMGRLKYLQNECLK